MPPKTTQKRLARSSRVLSVAAMGTIAALLAGGGGCATQMQRSRTYRQNAPVEQGSAATWSLVFNSPTVTQSLAAADPRDLREFARNNAALGFRPDTPVLATNEWPERARASLSNPRRIYLDPRADQLLYFENDSRPTGSYYRSGSSTYYNTGTWGFWR